METWKTEIPESFSFGSAVEVKSTQKIWLIGAGGEKDGVGPGGGDRILVFDIKTHIFEELESNLKVLRVQHKCIVTNLNGNEVILVTGGIFSGKLVEMINTQNGSVTMLKSEMVFARFGHGIGILRIKNEDKIVVFGGCYADDNVEIFDNETKRWKLAPDIKMSQDRYFFSFPNF